MLNGILLALIIAIILLWIGGGLFLWKISGKQSKIHQLFTKTWRIFFAWILPPWKQAVKTFIVVALIAIGFALIMAAPRWDYYEVVTGFRYFLDETPVQIRVPDYYCTDVQLPGVGVVERCGFIYRTAIIYKYNLRDAPVETTISQWWLDSAYLISGLWFIVAGLLVAAYWTVKAVNRLYGVE